MNTLLAATAEQDSAQLGIRQTVREVVARVQSVLKQQRKHRRSAALERLVEPERSIFF